MGRKKRELPGDLKEEPAREIQGGARGQGPLGGQGLQSGLNEGLGPRQPAQGALEGREPPQPQKKKPGQTARRLTPAEERRRVRFEQLCAEMAVRGFRQRYLTVDLLQWKSQLAIYLTPLPVMLALGLAYLLWAPGPVGFSLAGCLLLAPAYLLCIPLHEAIHGLTWGLCGKGGFAAIEFGVIWEALAPYCTCSVPMKRGQYLLGSAMPTLLLGLAPALAGVLTGSLWLFCLGQLMVLSGGGDLYMMLLLLRCPQAGAGSLCLDHPCEMGLVVFRPAD